MINYRYNNLLSISEISKLIDSKDYNVVKKVFIHGYKEAKIIKLDNRFEKNKHSFQETKICFVVRW